MSDTTSLPMEAHEAGCESCAKLAAEQAASENTSFAFLLALVPVLALTLMGNLGLV